MADDYKVQSLSTTGSGASLNLILLSPVQAGNFLHAWAAGQTNPPTSVADDVNGSYSAGPTANHSGSVQAIFSGYKENVGAGVTTVTATYAAGVTDGALVVHEVGFVNSASAIDKQASLSNQAATGTPSSGTTAATAQAIEWVTACLSIRLSAMSGYTAGYVIAADSITYNGRKLSVGSLSTSSTGAQAFSASASADDACGAIVTFKLTPPEPKPERFGGVAFSRSDRRVPPGVAW